MTMTHFLIESEHFTHTHIGLNTFKQNTFACLETSIQVIYSDVRYI